jgi:hypothetical protein
MSAIITDGLQNNEANEMANSRSAHLAHTKTLPTHAHTHTHTHTHSHTHTQAHTSTHTTHNQHTHTPTHTPRMNE